MANKQEGDNIIGDNNQLAGVAVGPGSSASTGSVTQSATPLAPDDSVDAAQFREDVTQILEALINAKEELEAKHVELTTAFMELKRQSDQFDGKAMQDVAELLEDLWVEKTSEEFGTTLGKLDGTAILEAILSSPVLAAMAS
ncbi:MAG: hypothetical protein ACOC9J_01070 [Persicimonas sp.]